VETFQNGAAVLAIFFLIVIVVDYFMSPPSGPDGVLA
jgi:hypothetical protein